MKSIIFLALIPVLYAVSVPEECPNIPPLKVNLAKTLGKWYVISRYPNPYDNNYRCEEAVYTRNNDGVFIGNFTGINITTGLKEKFDCVATARAEGVADFDDVTIKNGVETPANLLYVAGDRDLEKYLVFWICENTGTRRSTRLLWVLSRKPSLGIFDQLALKVFYARYGVAQENLIAVNHQRC